jgi:hypothetical protein
MTMRRIAVSTVLLMSATILALTVVLGTGRGGSSTLPVFLGIVAALAIGAAFAMVRALRRERRSQ